PWRPARVGAYFFDGGHSFEDQFEGLQYVLPSLADDAVVVIDDTNKRAARSADRLFARMVAGFELVRDIRTPRNHHPTWWNGVQPFRFRPLPAPLRPIAEAGPPYRLRKFLYASVALNFKHRRRAFNRRIKEMIRGRPRHA